MGQGRLAGYGVVAGSAIGFDVASAGAFPLSFGPPADHLKSQHRPNEPARVIPTLDDDFERCRRLNDAVHRKRRLQDVAFDVDDLTALDSKLPR